MTDIREVGCATQPRSTTFSGSSSAWSEFSAWNREVAGSNPAFQTTPKETRKAGVLIRFEPGDVLTGVGVRSPQSPPTHNGECSLMAKPQTVNLVDIGSSPFIHPKPMEKWPSALKALVC